MKKIVLLSLALVLALGGMGVGYAMWSDTVVINGSVATGTLDVSFDDVEPPGVQEYHWSDYKLRDFWVTGEETEYGDPHADPQFPEKNVAQTTAEYLDDETDCRTGKIGHERLQIDITNAYPYYIAGVTFKLHNIGSVPLDIVRYVISGQKQELDGTPVYDLIFDEGDDGVEYQGTFFEDVDDDGVVDEGDIPVINLTVSNTLPFQIDPCTRAKREIDFEFLQGLEQTKKYVITVVVEAEQWAE